MSLKGGIKRFLATFKPGERYLNMTLRKHKRALIQAMPAYKKKKSDKNWKHLLSKNNSSGCKNLGSTGLFKRQKHQILPYGYCKEKNQKKNHKNHG